MEHSKGEGSWVVVRNGSRICSKTSEILTRLELKMGLEINAGEAKQYDQDWNQKYMEPGETTSKTVNVGRKCGAYGKVQKKRFI